MKSKNLIFAIVAAGITLVSCKKEPVDSNDTVPAESKVSERFENYLKDQEQSFSANANSSTVITGQQGTKIYLSGSNFADWNGNPLSGNVDVKLVEIYKKSSMILAKKVTLASDNGQLKPLVSGGEFFLEFTQNGQKVNVVNPVYVTTKAGDSYNLSMGYFNGEVDDDGDVTWLSDTTTVSVSTDSLSNYFYVFPFDNSINWVNCDYFFDDPNPQTSVIVDVPDKCTSTNTSVFIVFADENAVAQLYDYSNGTYTTGSYYTLPTGLDVFFVVVMDDGGQLKYAVQSNTLTMNHYETISNLTNVSSMSELETILDGLF